MRIFLSFVVGLIFGLGLVISQMTNPSKIVAFLNIAGDWDPSLIIVMAAALVTTTIGYRLAWSRQSPVLAPQFQLPTNTKIDSKLVAGSGLFGVGWGLSGLCPGPGVASLAVAGGEIYVFFAAMIAGMFAAGLVRG